MLYYVRLVFNTWIACTWRIRSTIRRSLLWLWHIWKQFPAITDERVLRSVKSSFFIALSAAQTRVTSITTWLQIPLCSNEITQQFSRTLCYVTNVYQGFIWQYSIVPKRVKHFVSSCLLGILNSVTPKITFPLKKMLFMLNFINMLNV